MDYDGKFSSIGNPVALQCYKAISLIDTMVISHV